MKGKTPFNVREAALKRVECSVRYHGLDLGRSLPVAMTDRSVKLTFPQRGAPDIPLGDELDLTVSVDGKDPFSRRALVRSRVDSETDRIYAFELIQTRAMREELERALVLAFNVRGAFRVRPDAAAPIGAAMFLPDFQFNQPLTVLDISATGVAGWADLEAEEVLSARIEVGLRMTLGHTDQTIELRARIVGRDLSDQTVTYRFAFAPDTAWQERELEKVMQYVMERQRSVVATTLD